MQWTSLNGITAGQTITDHIITIAEYISFTKYDIETQLGLDQSGPV
jgi:hypothetical protein